MPAHRATEISSGDLSFATPRDELGRGAMGVVYRATWQGVEVAVKALRPGGALLAQQELEMLLTEAATLASLRHPNVVAFLGVCLDLSLIHI